VGWGDGAASRPYLVGEGVRLVARDAAVHPLLVHDRAEVQVAHLLAPLVRDLRGAAAGGDSSAGRHGRRRHERRGEDGQARRGEARHKARHTARRRAGHKGGAQGAGRKGRGSPCPWPWSARRGRGGAPRWARRASAPRRQPPPSRTRCARSRSAAANRPHGRGALKAKAAKGARQFSPRRRRRRRRRRRAAAGGEGRVVAQTWASRALHMARSWRSRRRSQGSGETPAARPYSATAASGRPSRT
jgi:hypothetical protein